MIVSMTDFPTQSVSNTFDDIEELHIQSLLERGVIKKKSEAQSYIKTVLVEFYLNCSSSTSVDFQFFLTFDPEKKNYENELYWCEETNTGKYLVPSLTFDRIDYFSQACIPPFFDQIYSSWSDSEKDSLAHFILMRLFFRLYKFPERLERYELDDYCNRLNTNKGRNNQAKKIAEDFSRLRDIANTFSGEFNCEATFNNFVEKLIYAGRRYERHSLGVDHRKKS